MTDKIRIAAAASVTALAIGGLSYAGVKAGSDSAASAPPPAVQVSQPAAQTQAVQPRGDDSSRDDSRYGTSTRGEEDVAASGRGDDSSRGDESGAWDDRGGEDASGQDDRSAPESGDGQDDGGEIIGVDEGEGYE